LIESLAAVYSQTRDPSIDSLMDKIIAFIAPIVIGGEGAKTAVAGKGVDKVVNSFKLKRVDIKRFSQDIMVSGYIAARN